MLTTTTILRRNAGWKKAGLPTAGSPARARPRT